MGVPVSVVSLPESPGRSRLPVRPPLWCIYLIWVGLLAGGAFAFPAHHLMFWTPMGLSAVIAGVIGVRRYRPSHPVAWYMFYLALLSFITGDSVYDVLTEMLNQDNPYPSLADVFYLAMYPLIACGLLALVRARTTNRDWASLVDALTITTGLGLLSWVYLILPYVNAAGLTPLQRATSIAYPLVRRPGPGHAGPPARWRAADPGPAVAGPRRRWAAGLRRAVRLDPAARDLACRWPGRHRVGPVLLGLGRRRAAPVHAQGQRAPTERRAQARACGQIALLAATSLIAPAVLLGEAVTGQGNHAATVAVFSAALNLLVVTRLAVIVGVHQASVRRERVLRSCGESLVSAQEPDDVYQAAVAAVDLLAGETAEVRTGLYVADAEGIRLVAGAHADDQQELATWRQAQHGGGLTEAGTLSVSPLRYDQELRGMLVVRSRTALAAETHSALAGLASQVALALESVTLAADIRQRQKDAHFKGLIQNASDVIVVVDGDGMLSYATPSLERSLGWTPERVRRTALVDLVHADDAHDAAQCLAAVQRVRSPLVRGYRLCARTGPASTSR